MEHAWKQAKDEHSHEHVLGILDAGREPLALAAEQSS